MNIKGKTYSEIYILWVLELKQKLQAMHVKHLLNLQTVFLSGCFSLSRGTKSQNTCDRLVFNRTSVSAR